MRPAAQRLLFEFEGHASGSDGGSGAEAARYLAECAVEVEREVIRELEYALPAGIRAEVDLRFAPDRLAWTGRALIRSSDGGELQTTAELGVLESLIHLATDHALAQPAALFGAYGVRTRGRRAPRSEGAGRAAVDPVHETLAALEDRLQRQGRLMMLGFALTLLALTVLGFGLVGMRGRQSVDVRWETELERAAGAVERLASEDASF